VSRVFVVFYSVSSSRESPTLAEFRDQCRRQLQRTLAERIQYGFCRTYKPVLDDAPYRVFESMEEYRSWCEAHLPAYLGYKVVRE
jgi:hypothetical protein